MDHPQTYVFSFINDKKCPLLYYIKNGIKTVEGRKYSVTYQNIKVGDYIYFRAKNEKPLKVIVTYIHKYGSLKEYLVNETIEKALPCVNNYNDAENIYNQWSSEKERQQLKEQYGYGFVGFGIKVVN